MDKKFAVASGSSACGAFSSGSYRFATYEEAEKKAKQLTANGRGVEYAIWQAIAMAKSPTPNIEIEKFN